MNELTKIVNLFVFTTTLSVSDPIQQIRQQYTPAKIAVPSLTKNLYEFPEGQIITSEKRKGREYCFGEYLEI